jgi:hypothetical protein
MLPFYLFRSVSRSGAAITLLVQRENMNSEIRTSAAQLRRTLCGSMRRLSIVTSVVVLLSACDNEKRPLSPASPSPTFPAAQNGPYILSGVVFEVTNIGRMPVEGVSVYCDSCGDPLGHTWADTDANGFYSFSWTANGQMPLIVKKEGYQLAGGLPTGPVKIGIVATVNGNTRFDIELVRR